MADQIQQKAKLRIRVIKKEEQVPNSNNNNNEFNNNYPQVQNQQPYPQVQNQQPYPQVQNQQPQGYNLWQQQNEQYQQQYQQQQQFQQQFPQPQQSQQQTKDLRGVNRSEEGSDFMKKIFDEYLKYEYINCIEESPVSAPKISNLKVMQVKQMVEEHILSKELLDWYFQAIDWCVSRDKIKSLKQDMNKSNNNIKVFWPEIVQEALKTQSLNNTALNNTALYFYFEQYLDAGFRLTDEYDYVVFAHTESDLSTYLMVMTNQYLESYYVGRNHYDQTIHDRMFDLIKWYNKLADIQDSKRSEVVMVNVDKNIEILYVINRIMYKFHEISLDSSYNLEDDIQINDQNTKKTKKLIQFVGLLMIGKLDQIFIEKYI